MPVGYTDCPYCYKETELDYEGQKNGDVFTATCEHCHKDYEVYFELTIDFYSSVKKELEEIGVS